MGKKTKCDTPCPTLQVHNGEMHEAESVKYLGNIVTSEGGVTDTIEDRRNKGWGKVASILVILSEVDMGARRVEVGLLLRKSILVNILLFTAETWSGVKEANLRRLEQVDHSLLCSLISSHSNASFEFLHMETGTLKFSRILSMNRILYHYHLLTLDKKETIKKIYEKQKLDPTKGDSYQLLNNDFVFIEKDINEEKIKSYSKNEYKKLIKKLIQKAAFKHLMKIKENTQNLIILLRLN